MTKYLVRSQVYTIGSQVLEKYVPSFAMGNFRKLYLFWYNSLAFLLKYFGTLIASKNLRFHKYLLFFRLIIVLPQTFEHFSVIEGMILKGGKIAILLCGRK